MGSVRKSIASRKPQRKPDRTPPSRAAPARHQYLLTLRSAFIFAASCVAGSAIGALTYLSPASPARAALAGLTAFAATIAALNSLIA